MLKIVDDPEQFNLLAQHVTQSWQWGEFRAQTPTVKKVVRLGSFSGGKLKKVFQIFFHHNPNIPNLANFPNCVAYLPRSAAPTESELEEIGKLCREEQAVYLTLEPLNEVSYPILKGQPILPAHTLYIDLTNSEDNLLSAMHEKTRYNIRLAGKRGVEVRNENSTQALENFIKLLSATESRQGFYSHYPDYYRKLWSILRPANMVYLLSAYLPENNGQSPIASLMLFRFKDFLYYPYGGSEPKFREYMAPNLLQWEAIKLGKKMGCKIYDMWGSYKGTLRSSPSAAGLKSSPTESDAWWGIYRFKKGFGGMEKEFPTYEVPFNRFWYRSFKAGNNLRWTMLRALRKINF